MNIDDVPEYREMRTGLMALRLEVPPSIADDVLARCEKAILAVRDAAYKEGYDHGLVTGVEDGRGISRWAGN